MDKLILNNVYKDYKDVKAVRDISFSVKDKEFVSIVGPSGCGKSSTLRMIAGLESITSGDIILNGTRINDIIARDRDIALSFESYALYPHLTTAGNLAFPLQVRGFNKKEINQKIESTLELLDLKKYRDSQPGELSGGQQQRISLGRALIREASIYLLDEPLSHLDAQTKVELRAQLLRIHKINELTFILVTHDQSEALAMSDRIIVMNDGKIMQVGTSDELYNDPANFFVADFIGEPPMNFIKGKIISSADGLYRHKCEEMEFNLSREISKNLSKYIDKKIIMGIRPQYIDIVDKPGINTNEGKVYSYEFLGEKGFLMIELNDERILIDIEHEKKYIIGEKVYFTFKDEYICLFDPETGERV